MPQEDRAKWNAKYKTNPREWDEPSRVVMRLVEYLPSTGRAIDVAGGAGRHSVWLAERGLRVTLADISAVGLELARNRASRHGVTLETMALDLEEDDFPAGPWDVIFSHQFLCRSLIPRFVECLAPGGKLIVIQPTVTNLLRHQKPPRPYLLGDGELLSLVGGQRILHYEEDWLEEGRHEAVIVAQTEDAGERPPLGS